MSRLVPRLHPAAAVLCVAFCLALPGAALAADATTEVRGASANAKYRSGVAVFTLTKTGLMYEASVGGQKFSYERLEAQGS